MKFLFTLIMCFVVLYSTAQKIENLKVEQKEGELLFQYDLTGAVDDFFKITIQYSNDKQNWIVMDKIYGDVGDSITSGKAKKAVLWIDQLKDVKTKMDFKITAEYYTVEQSKEGNLTDKNNYTYSWIRIGKTKWMCQNLKASKTDPDCGGLFNSANARNSCPDGWSLPSDENWMELELAFGVDKVKKYGLREIQLDKLKNTGFIIEECKYKTNFYPNQNALAFWTSSQNKMLYSGYSDKYLARIIRLNENKISKELRLKTEELSVRCVQSATYLAKIETEIETEINLSPVTGSVNHPYTGEKLEWLYIADNIWLKKDITGLYFYKELKNRCPAGWKVPQKTDWEKLFKEVKPSVKLNNKAEVISERFSTKGVWSLNLSSNDYWMNIPYYCYNTYWINNKDKEDSKKRIAFPTNKKGIATWVDRQTNEKAKVRCILDNEDYINKKNQIKNGTFTDTRDNKEYGFVEINGTTWMSENLNFDLGENSICRNNIASDCKLFGHMYNIQVIKNGCPDGWRIPNSEEWKYLLINKAANNLKILYPFGGTGFNLLLGGKLIYDDKNKEDVYTAKYLFVKDGKPGYYFIDSNGKVELSEKAKKKDHFYVRCVKN